MLRLAPLEVVFDHHRHVVRGPFGIAHVAMDGDAAQQVGRLRRQQSMIDANSVVPLPGPGGVVPEGVAARAAIDLAVA